MLQNRCLLFLGLVLFLLPTQVYGVTLEYDHGGFFATPYIYHKITEDSSGVIDPPITAIYDPGPISMVNNIPGGWTIYTESGYRYVESQVSWNLQTTYGKLFATSIQAGNHTNISMVYPDNRNSLRIDTQDGLFLKVAPEAGEKDGQPVKLYLSYDVRVVTKKPNPDDDPKSWKFEAGEGQANRFTVNRVPEYSLPQFQVSNICSSGECIPWPDFDLAVEFSFANYDGPWPYIYEIETETFIEAYPGELIHYPSSLADRYLMFDNSVHCKIGDVIGLDLGFLQDITDIRSDLGGYPNIYTTFDFTLTAQVVPLPGSVLLLGSGLLLLVGVRARRRS